MHADKTLRALADWLLLRQGSQGSSPSSIFCLASRIVPTLNKVPQPQPALQREMVGLFPHVVAPANGQRCRLKSARGTTYGSMWMIYDSSRSPFHLNMTDAFPAIRHICTSAMGQGTIHLGAFPPS